MKTRRYKKRRSFIKKGKQRIRKAKSKYRRRKSRTRKLTRKRKGGLSGLGIGLISLAGVGLGVGYFGSKHISFPSTTREIKAAIKSDRASRPDFLEWEDGGKGEWRKEYVKPKCKVPRWMQKQFHVDEFGKPLIDQFGKPLIDPQTYTPQEKAELNHWVTNC